MKIAELFAEVGFKFDTLKLREFNHMLGDLNISSIIGVSSLAGLDVAVKKLIEGTAGLSSNLKTIQENTGINPQFTQQLEGVSEALGAAKGDADSFLTSLSKAQLQIRMGKGNIQPFILGGLTYQDVIGTTEDLVKKINLILSRPIKPGDKASMERQKQFRSFLNEGFGASPGLLKSLIDPKLFEKMLQFNTLNAEQIERSAKAQYQWVLATNNLDIAFKSLASTVLPFLSATSIALTEVLKIVDKLHVIPNILKLSPLANVGKLIEGRIALQEAKAERETQRNQNMVNNITLHVKSDTPEEFIRNFDPLFKKHLEKMFASSDTPFGQAT